MSFKKTVAGKQNAGKALNNAYAAMLKTAVDAGLKQVKELSSNFSYMNYAVHSLAEAISSGDEQMTNLWIKEINERIPAYNESAKAFHLPFLNPDTLIQEVNQHVAQLKQNGRQFDMYQDSWPSPTMENLYQKVNQVKKQSGIGAPSPIPGASPYGASGPAAPSSESKDDIAKIKELEMKWKGLTPPASGPATPSSASKDDIAKIKELEMKWKGLTPPASGTPSPAAPGGATPPPIPGTTPVAPGGITVKPSAPLARTPAQQVQNALSMIGFSSDILGHVNKLRNFINFYRSIPQEAQNSSFMQNRVSQANAALNFYYRMEENLRKLHAAVNNPATPVATASADDRLETVAWPSWFGGGGKKNVRMDTTGIESQTDLQKLQGMAREVDAALQAINQEIFASFHPRLTELYKLVAGKPEYAAVEKAVGGMFKFLQQYTTLSKARNRSVSPAATPGAKPAKAKTPAGSPGVPSVYPTSAPADSTVYPPAAKGKSGTTPGTPGSPDAALTAPTADPATGAPTAAPAGIPAPAGGKPDWATIEPQVNKLLDQILKGVRKSERDARKQQFINGLKSVMGPMASTSEGQKLVAKAMAKYENAERLMWTSNSYKENLQSIAGGFKFKSLEKTVQPIPGAPGVVQKNIKQKTVQVKRRTARKAPQSWDLSFLDK